MRDQTPMDASSLLHAPRCKGGLGLLGFQAVVFGGFVLVLHSNPGCQLFGGTRGLYFEGFVPALQLNLASQCLVTCPKVRGVQGF